MNALIGETIESRPAFPVMAVLLAVVTLGVAVLCAVNDPMPNLAFVLVPAGMALGAYLAREKAYRFTVETEGLRIEAPFEDYVAFGNLLAVGEDRSRDGDSFPLLLFRTADCVRIPANLNVHSRDLYDFLFSQLPPKPPVTVPQDLGPFFEDQVAKFGADKVYVFRATDLPPNAPAPSVSRGVWLGFAVGALLAGFAFAGMVKDSERVTGSICVGVGFALFGGLIALAVRGERKKRSRHFLHTTLIITPFGFALQQDDVTGKLRWDEVKAIEHPPVKRAFQHATTGSKNGIGVQVAGAYIVIKDRFDDSADSITRLMKQFWRG